MNLKIYKMKLTLSILLAFVIHNASIAQPTINIGDLTPSFGSAFTGADATYTDPGSAGVNQTWDLTGMSPEIVSTSTFLSPSGLPESNSFPGATHTAFVPVEDAGELYGYITVENNLFEDMGYYSFGPEYDILFQYTNPRTVLVFPLSYNDSFSDTYQSEMENDTGSGILLSVSTGSFDAHVDGYGTLITPAGTFTDVLRVRYVEEANSTLSVQGIEISSSETTTTEYKYFKAGFPAPLATLRTTILMSMGMVIDETQTGGYLIDLGVGLEEYESLFTDVQIFPMPATTHIELQLNSKSEVNSDFMLLSSSGKMVHQWKQQPLLSGSNQLRLELPELAAGTYVLLFNSPDGLHTERVVVGK
jgi:hypothetical protein